MDDKPSIKDIAARVGVSAATVSRALKNSPLIAAATSARIREVAVEVGYRPNVSVRNLRTKRSMAVLLVVRDMSNPFYLEVFAGAEAEARAAGYAVLMGNIEGDSDRAAEYFQMLNDGHADGMILMTGRTPPASALHDFAGPPTTADGDLCGQRRNGLWRNPRDTSPPTSTVNHVRD